MAASKLSRNDASSFPGGTLTFLFSDIEGSTRLLRKLRSAYGTLLSDHAEISRAAFALHGGREVDTQGDSFFAVFSRARDAALAATALQRGLAGHAWPMGVRLRVRVGLHTGEPDRLDHRYIGLDVHRAARICAAAQGGQVLLSDLTAALIRDQLPDDVSLRSVGTVVLKDFDQPQALLQLVVDGLEN